MTIATATQCDANQTRIGFDTWGETWIRCEASRGLRSWIDLRGTTRYACPAKGHGANVERRFGLAVEEVEPCAICHRFTPIVFGTYQRFLKPTGDIFLVCDDCVEKADDADDAPDELVIEDEDAYVVTADLA